jgi:glucosamine--fructose-6-phosphate aminotransferase (isomerizing)
MDDRRLDPDAPLPAPPDPWTGSEMPSRRDAPPWHMTEMIEAEPALAARLLVKLADRSSAAAQLAAAVRTGAAAGRPILVTGCGTSEHGAVAVADILREAASTAGLPSRYGAAGCPIAVQAFEGSLDDVLGGEGGVVIGVSHEGGTWATNRALEQARRSGATVALITASERSPGAALADIVVTTDEQDQSWCHTVGYLSPILAGASIAAHLTGARLDPVVVRGLLAAGLAPDAIATTEHLAGALAGVERLIVTGTGVDRAPARELVLKVEEGAHLPAAMRDLETVLHGHLAGMDESTGLVLVLTDTAAGPDRTARATAVLRAAAAIGIRTGAILGSAPARLLDPSLTPAGRLVVPDSRRRLHRSSARRSRCSSSPSDWPAPAASTPTRFAATTRATSPPPRPPADATPASQLHPADQLLGQQVDHVEIVGQEVLEHDSPDSGRREPRHHRPRLGGRAEDPAVAARLEPVDPARSCLPERAEERIGPPCNLRLVAPDQRPDHRRPRERRRLAADRPAGLVERPLLRGQRIRRG